MRIDPKCHICFFHHDRGFHLSERGKERENWEGRVCDGNNAPPETKKKESKKRKTAQETADKTADVKSLPWHLANKRSLVWV